ncbi:MAG: methyl-accepting chemotaxis protein [Terriglobales bacterium]
MEKLTLKMKLTVGFGLLLTFLMLTASFDFYATRHLVSAAEEANAALTRKELATSIEVALRKQVGAANDFTFTADKSALQRHDEAKQEVAQKLTTFNNVLVTEKGRALVARIQGATDKVSILTEQQIGLRRAHRTREATRLAFGLQAQATMKEVADDLGELAAWETKLAQDGLDAEHSAASTNQIAELVLAITGFVIGVTTAIFVARSIAGNVGKMLTMIQAVSTNNLAVEDMEVTSQDELGQASIALNRMKNSLHELVQSIAATAEHVASASEEISSTASQQSQGAVNQRDQAAQVATALQEMAATVLQVSQHSNKAAEAARHASETAHHGGSIVEETLSKMRVIAQSVGGTAGKMVELGKSSDQIGRIIGVIDDIADQTNLLALNAAIEAARAGEQGRGFAVVADEVRKLAERTTTATKEIARMIKNIQDETKSAVTAMEQGTTQVEEGVASTVQAGDSLKEIIRMAEQVGEMISHIATAATQQSSATEEVNNNMEQIARLVKESADGAHQSAKACQDLSELALDLQKMVGNFKLEKGNGHNSNGRGKAALGSSSQSRTPLMPPQGNEPTKALAAVAH